MLYLNNPLLTTERIITYFENNLSALSVPTPENSKRPSTLQIFQNKLKGNFFEDLGRDKSNEDVLARLAEDERFSANYLHLKHTLEIIFALDESSVNQDSLDASGIVSDWDAAQEFSQFETLEARYGYFQNTPENQGEALHALFKKLAISCRIMIVLFERNNTPTDTMAYDYAYKIMALFVDPTQELEVEQLFNSIAPKVYKLLTQSDTKTDKAFHDVFLVKLSGLPDARLLSDMPGWRAFIEREGQKAFLFFKMAKRLEDKIAEQTQQGSRAPKDLKEAKAMEALCAYSRALEDLAFAELCRAYDVSEHRFNACLNYMAESPGWPKKDTDNIPNHQIQGREAAEGFAWVKLPEGDKRALILGDITDCCQSIEGDSEECVKDAVTLDDNGLYVLLKQRKTGERAPLVNGVLNTQDFKLVGLAYVWNSITGNLCLDSIECLPDSISDAALHSILQDFATQVINENPDIHFVTLGEGGGTPETLFDKVDKAPIPEVMRQGIAYGDASVQFNIKAQGAEMIEPLPEDIGSSEFQDGLNYLRPYLSMSDTIEFVKKARQLLKENPSIQHEMTPWSVQVLLSFTPKLTLDDLRPVDFDALDEMSSEVRNRALKGISTGRLVWMQTTPEALHRAIRYVPKEQEINILMTLHKLQPRLIVGYITEYFDEIQSVKIIGLSALEFGDVMQRLSPEQCRVLFDVVKDELKDLIESIADFKSVIQVLSLEQRAFVFDVMKDELKDLIESIADFKSVIQALSPEQRAYLFDTMIDELKNLTKSFYSLKSVLEHISPEQRRVFLDAMKDQLRDLIKTVGDFKHVMEYLSSDQRAYLFDTMIDELKGLIESFYKFKDVMECLSPEQCRVLLDAMKDQLRGLIKTLDDFKYVMERLLPEQRRVLLDTMIGDLIGLINTLDDFNYVMEIILPGQRTFVLDTMKDELIDLIKTVDDFSFVMKRLPPKRGANVFDAKKHDLKNLINTIYDFNHAIEALSSEQSRVLLDTMKDKLKGFIKKMHDFNYLIKHLSTERLGVLLDVMHDELKDLIKTKYDFTTLTLGISEEKITLFIKHGEGMFSRACSDGVVDFAAFLIDKGVKPTEEMLLHACRDQKLEVVHLLASKLIPGVLDDLSSGEENHAFEQVAYYVGGINQNNLDSIVETGLQAFILNQQISNQASTVNFKDKLDEIKPPEQSKGGPSRSRS